MSPYGRWSGRDLDGREWGNGVSSEISLESKMKSWPFLLSSWFVSRFLFPVWVGLGGVALLKELWHQGWALRVTLDLNLCCNQGGLNFAILLPLPQPPEHLGLQTCSTRSGALVSLTPQSIELLILQLIGNVSDVVTCNFYIRNPVKISWANFLDGYFLIFLFPTRQELLLFLRKPSLATLFFSMPLGDIFCAPK